MKIPVGMLANVFAFPAQRLQTADAFINVSHVIEPNLKFGICFIAVVLANVALFFQRLAFMDPIIGARGHGVFVVEVSFDKPLRLLLHLSGCGPSVVV